MPRRKDSKSRVLRIGKNGVTSGFLGEAMEQLEQASEVKIKLPRGMEPDERDVLAQRLAEKTGSLLVERRGNIVLLRKR